MEDKETVYFENIFRLEKKKNRSGGCCENSGE